MAPIFNRNVRMSLHVASISSTNMRPSGACLLVILQLIGAFVLADFFKRLGFNLADTLASDAELLPHLLKCVVDAVIKSVSHFKNFSLFGRKLVENLAHLVGQNAVRRNLVWRKDVFVGNKITQCRAVIAVIPNGGLKRSE